MIGGNLLVYTHQAHINYHSLIYTLLNYIKIQFQFSFFSFDWIGHFGF